MIPVDSDNNSLLDNVPIWSDSRPGKKELATFFEQIDEEDWYMRTGNGFPAKLYTVFKVLWLKNHMPDIYENTRYILGTKDFINLLLTGVVATDHSYASGSGVYSLNSWQYDEELLELSGLRRELFPDIVPSTEVIGTILPQVSQELGLPKGIKVVAGGVDNSCMALGAKCIAPGRTYTSLGSSSWIAVSSENPVLEKNSRPYVFSHVVPGMFVSATAIFSAGSSFRWFKEQVAPELSYEEINRIAEQVPVGCEGLLFNPTLAGGSCIDKSPNAKGGFVGLTLSHTRAHMARSVLEGVALGLRIALDVLRNQTQLSDQMLMVGGGSKGALWRDIFANSYSMSVVRSNINDQAAALGAAALALVGSGIWSDFSKIDELHVTQTVDEPEIYKSNQYNDLLVLFKDTANFLSDLGDRQSEQK